MTTTRRIVLLFSALIWTAPAMGQSQPAASSAGEASPEEEKSVAVSVNGQPILKSDIEELFHTVIERQTGRRNLPEGMIQQAREQLWGNLTDVLIADELLDQDVGKNNIAVSDKEMKKEFRTILSGYLIHNHSTPQEFEQQLQTRRDMSLQEFVDERITDPAFKQSVLHERLLEKKFPDQINITDQEIQERYDTDLQEVYTQPEMVRVSHILIKPEGSAEEQRAAARTRAEQLLKQVKGEDTDFAELAQKHSSCPSKAQGGDLGYFPRKGAMLEPFAAAAFALKEGQVSDVVETNAGYHIIKLTGRKDQAVTSLEQARDSIRHQLRSEKLGGLKEQYVSKLKEVADIVYPSESPASGSESEAPESSEGEG